MSYAFFSYFFVLYHLYHFYQYPSFLSERGLIFTESSQQISGLGSVRYFLMSVINSFSNVIHIAARSTQHTSASAISCHFISCHTYTHTVIYIYIYIYIYITICICNKSKLQKYQVNIKRFQVHVFVYVHFSIQLYINTKLLLKKF